MIQYASRAQLKEKAREQMAGLTASHPACPIPAGCLIVFSHHLCVQHAHSLGPYRTDTYGRKRRDISDGISAFDGDYDFIVDLCRSVSDRHYIILSEYCLQQACCNRQSILRLQILIQKIAWNLRSTDPAEYGMYTSV